MKIESILSAIAKHQPNTLTETSECAAVMIILLLSENQPPDIVITKRSATLLTYAGHYSFPGGIRDSDDIDLYATAKRETQEELNITANDYGYVGQLDDFLDRYARLVRPFVVHMPKILFEKNMRESTDEIEQLYYLSITKLSEMQIDETLQKITRRHPSYFLRDNETYIWGLTAMILVHLSNIIYGTDKSLGKELIK